MKPLEKSDHVQEMYRDGAKGNSLVNPVAGSSGITSIEKIKMEKKLNQGSWTEREYCISAIVGPMKYTNWWFALKNVFSKKDKYFGGGDEIMKYCAYIIWYQLYWMISFASVLKFIVHMNRPIPWNICR